MTRTRQLAAIMFTDIQGYTALMQQDEQKAIQFRDKHRSIFNEITKKYNGKILQYYGDGTLSIFDSAIDAVNCAIEMQIGFQQDPSIPIRIGIHSGDIIFSEEEIIGDGVNIASRVESLALAGSVLISGKVYEEIKNQTSIQASFLKNVQLKNVDRPLDIYAVSNTGLVIPEKKDIIDFPSKPSPSFPVEKFEATKKKKLTLPLSAAAIIILFVITYLQFKPYFQIPAMISEKSIAVLPFVNMSNDPDQEYFSDGITEEILNSLANIPGLKVAGRTSSFYFKGKNEDIRSIGEKLDVKMVLEGSVRKGDKQVRITAQLINVTDGFHLWSETYDRELEDIFTVQEEIAKQIVDKLKLQVTQKVTDKNQTQNVQAYEQLLKGIYFLKRSYEGTVKAMDYFQKAVELDPEYAKAYAFIGKTYIQFAGFNILPTSEAYSNARTVCEKALSLNPQEPEAHKVLAYIHMFYDWNWDLALQDYERAIQYDEQEYNEFLTYYEIFLNKNYDNAIRISKKILKTDPLDTESRWQLGICYYFAARFEEALKVFNDVLELDSTYSSALQWRGTILGYLGRYDEAVKSMQKSLEITRGEGLANIEMIFLKIQMGNKEEALKEIESMDFVDPMDAAKLYTELGMIDKAMDWVEKGYYARSVMMVTLKHGWLWDPLRDNHRFKEIYKKMNFNN